MIDPAHLTDAELAAWYGMGLHAPKAQRLIEEVRRLRAHLAEVEAEFARTAADALVVDRERMELSDRLAEVEAERDSLQRQWQRDHDEMSARRKNAEARLAAALRRAEAAEVRLAAVLALAADECMHGPLDRDDDDCFGCKLRAAAQGEGDRG